MTRLATIDVEGMEDLEELLEGMGDRVRHWHVTAPRIQDFLTMRTRDRFASNNKSEGGADWRKGYPNQPRWRAIKKRANAGDLTVLRWKSGKERLFPSWVKINHPEHIFRVGGDHVVYGTRVPYAARLQRGGPTPFGEVAPPYDMATLGAATRGRFAQLMVIYIVRGEARGNQWRE